ncbi:MAG: hypothetical protein ACXADB_02870 [Candidatus Hermodarchaeia archaeon]
MTHPFRELAAVIPDREPELFSPEKARELIKQFKPQRDKKKEAERKKKRQDKLNEEIERNKALDRLRDEIIEYRWPKIEKQIKRVAKGGGSSITIRLGSKIHAKVMRSCLNDLGWRSKRGYNNEVEITIYWGRFAWLRIWWLWLLLSISIVTICLVILLNSV